MDAETSLAQVVASAVPASGATWRALRAELPDVTVYALEGALKALRASGVLMLVPRGDSGVWHRAGRIPIRAQLGPRVTLKLANARRIVTRPRTRKVIYAPNGDRWCSYGSHHVPLNRFSKGGAWDGLHVWCKECRKDYLKVERDKHNSLKDKR